MRPLNQTMFAIVTSFLSMTALADGQLKPPITLCQDPKATTKCDGYKISLVALLANPDQYDGRRVNVSGYLHIEFEGTAIYLHRDDYIHTIFANGIWLYLPNDLGKISDRFGCKSDQYASILGTFSAKHRGHMGAWSGSIDRIEHCTSLLE